MDHQHKCIECGYLTYRRIIPLKFSVISELAEVERGEDGKSLLPGFLPALKVYPFCFMRAFHLQSEYNLERLSNESDKEFDTRFKQWSGIDPKKVLEVINQTRDCKDFTKWQQGFTPKEHRDMMDRDRQLDREAKSKKSDRLWHIVELVITLAVGAIIAVVATNK